MKPIIYQAFPRWFGNRNTTRKPYGTLQENGCGKLNDLTADVLDGLRQLGVTHMWYTGIVRHATQTDYSRYGIPCQCPQVVKGQAGSPYAIADYYDVSPDLAVDVDQRHAEFRQLVVRTHQAGLKVVLDFVPNHVARQYRSVKRPDGVADLGQHDDTSMHFSTRNNFYYLWGQPLDLSHATPQVAEGKQSYTEIPAKATGNDQFSPCPSAFDWYETVKLNYGIDYCDAGGRSEHFDPRPDTWQKMLDILLFWAGLGVDSFRCDMVFMVPVPFWKWAIAEVRKAYPDVTFIGEIYDPGLYRDYIGAGFDWLYDKVGMYDTLFDVVRGHRRAGEITTQWQAVDDIRDHMLYFLENHDELRIASDYFAGEARKALPALGVAVLLGRNPFMLYAGQEYGERGMDQEGYSGLNGRTTIFDYWSLSSLCRAAEGQLTADERSLYDVYRRLLNLANSEPAVARGQMFDLMYVNQHLADRQYAFLRKEKTTLLLVVANFDGADTDAKVLIPRHAFDCLHLAEGAVVATDLLTGNTTTLALSPDKPVAIRIEAYGCVVLRCTL